MAFGDSVSLAQRMVNRARAGEFVMSEAVMGALSVENLDLDAEPLPQLELPRRSPIRIYGVLVEGRLDFTCRRERLAAIRRRVPLRLQLASPAASRPGRTRSKTMRVPG